MKFTTRDLGKLRWPILGALLLLITAGLLAGWSLRNAEQAEQQRRSAETGKNQIEQRLRQVRTEEQEIKERTQIFLHLQKTGMAGEERRLDWTEMLQKIQHDMRLPGISYEFGAQQTLEKTPGLAYAYLASPMRLQLRLLHEEDLLNFLARVQKEARALVLVRRCEALPQLNAECELQWITLQRPPNTK